MRAGWRFTLALGLVGVVAVSAAAFGQTGSGEPRAEDPDTVAESRRERIAACRERSRAAETDAERERVRRACGRHRGHARARRVVHSEAKVQTREGEFVLVITDAGTVTAVDADARTLTIERADGETVSVTAGEDTRIRKDREQATLADVAVGDHARIVQVDAGEGLVVRGIVAHDPATISGERADETADDLGGGGRGEHRLAGRALPAA